MPNECSNLRLSRRDGKESLPAGRPVRVLGTVTAVATTHDVRRICLSLPEAEEVETWGHPTFRVKGKVFAGMGNDDDPEVSVSFKAEPDERDVLLALGEPWFVPAYVGRHGWLGARLVDDLEVAELDELLVTSWRLIAPKRLVKAYDETEGA
jgi:predicted DNA-binding protein (MmcQ/YjbR family)